MKTAVGLVQVATKRIEKSQTFIYPFEKIMLVLTCLSDTLILGFTFTKHNSSFPVRPVWLLACRVW